MGIFSETGQVKGCLPVWRDCQATHMIRRAVQATTPGRQAAIEGRREMGRGSYLTLYPCRASARGNCFGPQFFYTLGVYFPWRGVIAASVFLMRSGGDKSALCHGLQRLFRQPYATYGEGKFYLIHQLCKPGLKALGSGRAACQDYRYWII